MDEALSERLPDFITLACIESAMATVNRDRFCGCCQKYLSNATFYRHQQKAGRYNELNTALTTAALGEPQGVQHAWDVDHDQRDEQEGKRRASNSE